MTYHVGLGPRLAAALGDTEHGPYISCDEPGCCAVASGTTKRGDAAAWLRYGTAPRGWLRVGYTGTTIERRDFCPEHRRRSDELAAPARKDPEDEK